MYTFISLTCSTDNQRYLYDLPIGNAYLAYQALSRVYASKSAHSIFQLLCKVFKANQGGKSANEFTTQVSHDTKRLRVAVTEMKLDIFNVLEATALLNGADAAYSTTVEALLVSDNTSVQQVRKALIERCERIKAEADDANTATAMVATNKAKPTKPCPNCLKEKGKSFYHWSSDCYLLHPEKRPQRTNRQATNGRHTFQGNKAEAAEPHDLDVTSASAWPAVAKLDEDTVSLTTAHTAQCNGKIIAKVDSGAQGCDIFLAPHNTTGLHTVKNVNVLIAQLGDQPVIATHQGLIGSVKGAPLRALTGAGITTTLLSVDALAQRNIALYISGNKSGNQVLFVDEDLLPTANPEIPFPAKSIVH